MKYQASKWIDLNLFINSEELEEVLPDVHYIPASGVQNPNKIEFSREEILSFYRNYLKTFTPFPPFYMTHDLNSIEIKEVGESKVILQPRLPVIHCQEHVMYYSKADGKFRSMVRGVDQIPWGIQFSFPQIFEDPETGEVLQTSSIPNGALFQTIQKWSRRSTRPTPVIVEGKKINLPMRLGKKNWENALHHPTLQKQGIQIDEKG